MADRPRCGSVETSCDIDFDKAQVYDLLYISTFSQDDGAEFMYEATDDFFLANRINKYLTYVFTPSPLDLTHK